MTLATPQYLLEGSNYALLQCGRLLQSAATSYNSGDHATAVGLTALAWEELGRSRYLRDQRKKAVTGETIAVEEIRDVCKNHLMKQEWGQTSVIQRFEGNSGLGKLVQTIHHASPQSEELQEARQQLDEVTERQKSRAPQDRHAQRIKAFYVEPTDLGTGWNKPWEKDRGEAKNFIEHAIGDYALQSEKFRNLGILRLDEPELANAVETWEERPDLPLLPSLH